MRHKVTHKNLIDSSPLFRYYLTHTPCNFFVKPIDFDPSKEIQYSHYLVNLNSETK